jgi:adenylate cyclase
VEEEIRSLEATIASGAALRPEVVDALNRLAALQLDSDPALSCDTAGRAAGLARQIKYKQGEKQALMSVGIAASKQRDFKKAKTYFSRALGVCKLLQDNKGIAEAHGRLGNANLHSGKYEQALEHYRVAIDIRLSLNDELGTADLYNNSGTIYLLQGNHALALKSLLKALHTFELSGNLTHIASASSNIGLIYWEQKNYEEALKMFHHALSIWQQAGNMKEVSKNLNNIGNVFHDQQNFPSAIAMHSKALELREQIGDLPNVAISCQNLGIVYKDMGEYTVAKYFLIRALSCYRDLADKRDLVLLHINLGELYFLMGEYEEAQTYLNGALKLAEEQGLKDPLREAYEVLSKLFAKQKNFEQAYIYQLRYTQLHKEISNAETSRQIAQMGVNREMEQKERNAELERAKNAELQKAFTLLEDEKKRSESLLNNILPEEVSRELKESGKTKARSYEMATVMFADIQGFTTISEQLTAEELVMGIDEYFEAFDRIVEIHGVEKIKTIGDAYLCAGGVPVAADDHAIRVIEVAKDFQRATNILRDKRTKEGKRVFDFRFGVHSGPVVAGVVGIKKFAYDIWGDTVNTAARMQQHSAPNHINISGSTYGLVRDEFICTYRGEIEAKNKGKMKMYFVE